MCRPYRNDHKHIKRIALPDARPPAYNNSYSHITITYEKKAMFDKLAGIEERYEELERLMSDPDVLGDYSKVVEYSKERAG